MKTDVLADLSSLVAHAILLEMLCPYSFYNSLDFWRIFFLYCILTL